MSRWFEAMSPTDRNDLIDAGRIGSGRFDGPLTVEDIEQARDLIRNASAPLPVYPPCGSSGGARPFCTRFAGHEGGHSL